MAGRSEANETPRREKVGWERGNHATSSSYNESSSVAKIFMCHNLSHCVLNTTAHYKWRELNPKVGPVPYELSCDINSLLVVSGSIRLNDQDQEKEKQEWKKDQVVM